MSCWWLAWRKLDLAEVAAVVAFLDVKVFAGVHHGFHHHVLEPGLLRQLDDAAAIGDRGRHRHRAGDMLAGPQGLEGLLGVVGDRRVDVDGVDFRVTQHHIVVGVTLGNPEGAGDGPSACRGSR